MNIYQRLNAVRKEVDYIKRGSAGQGTGVLYDEVVALSRELIVKHGVMITTDFLADSNRLAGQKQNFIYEAFIRVWYINIDEPTDKFYTDIVAHAMDSGDKAPGKALTYATKASLVKVLFLETGINDESRTASPDLYVSEQFDMFHDLIAEQKAFELFCFSKSISEDVFTSLYNSFPKGKTTSGKKECNALTKKGVEEFQNLINEIETLAENKDPAITQEVDGLNASQKRLIAGSLQESTVTFLKASIEAQE